MPFKSPCYRLSKLMYMWLQWISRHLWFLNSAFICQCYWWRSWKLRPRKHGGSRWNCVASYSRSCTRMIYARAPVWESQCTGCFEIVEKCINNQQLRNKFQSCFLNKCLNNFAAEVVDVNNFAAYFYDLKADNPIFRVYNRPNVFKPSIRGEGRQSGG